MLFCIFVSQSTTKLIITCGQDRSSRALLVAQKKSEAKLSAMEKSHSIEIESNTKEIKVESTRYDFGL